MENKFVVRPRRPAFGKTSVVSARLPDDMIDELDSVAKKTGRLLAPGENRHLGMRTKSWTK